MSFLPQLLFAELRFSLKILLNKNSKKQRWLKLDFIEIKRQCSKKKGLKRKKIRKVKAPSTYASIATQDFSLIFDDLCY